MSMLGTPFRFLKGNCTNKGFVELSRKACFRRVEDWRLTDFAFPGEKTMLGMIHILTIILFGIPLFVFGFYGAVLWYFGIVKKQKHEEENGAFEPPVSIVIPTHNEEVIIEKRINNLLQLNYPTDKLEIVFVDDSKDSTPEIIKECTDKYPHMHLIQFHERVGYSPSMRAGCGAAANEIVVLGDAGSFMEADAIRKLVRHFKNPAVGLVTGKSKILNVNEKVGSAESSYIRISDFVRRAESRMDSTFWAKGEATAVRKRLIEDLENCNATFDTTTALFVRKKGFKSIFDSEVKFYEYAPGSYEDWSKQKTIRAANWIKILFSFRSMFFRRKYGLFGCITLPMFFSMLVVVPIALLLGTISLAILTFLDLHFSLMIWAILGSLLLVSTLLSRRSAVIFFEFEYALLKATYQTIFTRTEHDKIDKVVSTRTHAIDPSE